MQGGQGSSRRIRGPAFDGSRSCPFPWFDVAERRPVRMWLDLDRELVDLGGRMAGPVVDPHHGLFRRSGCEAEDLPELRIEPGALEMHALVGLDIEVALMGRG